MGYSIDLIDEHKSLITEDVQRIFDELPESYRGISYSKQSWGWSTIVDVTIMENKNAHRYLKLSGSFSVSGTWAPLATVHWQQELYKLGYNNMVVISEDFGFNSKLSIHAYPRFKNILPESIRDFLANVPEDGCGTHLADIHLRDGTNICCMHILNCSEYYYCKEIKKEDVEYVLAAFKI